MASPGAIAGVGSRVVVLRGVGSPPEDS
jgi:hypothetical protein